jgi:hypothetical protein
MLSGAASGLALLSKSPALYLVGFLPLVTLTGAWSRKAGFRSGVWRDLAGWSLVVGLTYLLCWPALWTAPAETLRAVLRFVTDNANPEHAAVAEGGGPAGSLFYLAVVALRGTPLMLVGLGLLLLELTARLPAWRHRGSNVQEPSGGPAPPMVSAHRRFERGSTVVVLTLLSFAILFGLAMTFAAKSFDRYMLPAFPVLDLLAGYGIALSARRLRWIGGAGALLAGAFILPLLIYPIASTLPYAITWFNPLAGGAPAAQRVMSIGWGEGLDQVAYYLNTQPDASRLKVTVPGEIYTTVLGAQFVGQVMPGEGGDPSDNDASYLVWYIRTPGDVPPLYDPSFQTWQPERTVNFGGIDYARVYDARRGVPLGATFADLLRAEGYGVDQVVVPAGRALSVRVFWKALAPPSPSTRVVLSLLDQAGIEAATSTSALGTLEPDQLRGRAYRLPVPAALPPGNYTLWLALQTGPAEQLALTDPGESLTPSAPRHPTRTVLRPIVVR